MPHGYAFDRQWTLGQLIDALKPLSGDDRVRFAVGYISPCGLGSYRGYYEDIAIRFGHGECSVATLLADCEEAVGKEFSGWKGGSYRMSRDTPVWVANSDQVGGMGVVGINVTESDVVLLTDLVDP